MVKWPGHLLVRPPWRAVQLAHLSLCQFPCWPCHHFCFAQVTFFQGVYFQSWKPEFSLPGWLLYFGGAAGLDYSALCSVESPQSFPICGRTLPRLHSELCTHSNLSPPSLLPGLRLYLKLLCGPQPALSLLQVSLS